MPYLLLFPALFILALFLNTKVKFIIYEGVRVEITFTLITLMLSDFNDGSKQDKKLSFSLYKSIFTTIIDLLEQSEVELQRLAIPHGQSSGNGEYTSTYKYHIGISTFIAYLEAKSKKLYIHDNAVILIPDGDERLSLIFTVKSRLFYVIRAIIALWHSQRKSRKRRERENVRN